MKWNWGTGIFIFIVLFIAACVVFIYYAVHQKWTMVEEDYSPKELRHEEKLVKMRNANALSEPLRVTLDSAGLVIRFPADFRGKTLSGNIDIYRPSDETLDVAMPVKADTALCQRVPILQLSHGRYVAKVDWIADGRGFYREVDVFIP